MRTVDPAGWSSHPWMQMAPGAVFLIPLALLARYAHPHVTGTTDFGYGPDDAASVDVIWEDILANGMADPLVLAFCRPRSYGDPSFLIRLESGNHRLGPAARSGVSHLPVVSIVSEKAVFNPENGHHVVAGDRGRYHDWLRGMGRDPVRFEPYPHPGDPRALLPASDVDTYGAIVPFASARFSPAQGGLAPFTVAP